MSRLRNINWKHAGRIVLWAMVAILALNAGRLVYSGFRPSRARAASTVAYTVLRTENGFDHAGTLMYTNHYVEAVRSDGSKMWRGTTKDVQKRRIDFANGDHVVINELLARKSTYPKKSAGPPVPRDPKASCATTQELTSGWVIGGEDTIGAYRAVRMVYDSSPRTWTIWYSLDVGCAVLQLRLQHETGVTQQNLAAIISGEPDAALFQLSASSKEVPPSELFDCSGVEGRPCMELPDQTKQRMDNTYDDVRAKAATSPIPQ
jgi:hypothetical protein